MNDIPATIALLKTKLLEKLGDEVDLIFQYGSYLRGNTHPYSDVDLSFVPAHDDHWFSITVMVDERLFDFYPMHWSKLERMACFNDVSSSVLLESRVLYQRSDETAARFASLAGRLRGMLQPEARPQMLRLAQESFQTTAYPYYLLRQAAAAGHTLACLQQVQHILQAVLHSLAACNQACADTRKLEQVLALPKLPERFEETTRCLTTSTEPAELLAAAETLLQTTRALLLAEQRSLPQPAAYPDVLHSAYPELKRDIQAILLGCQRHNDMGIRGSVVSLYHELSRAMAQVERGIEYTHFNSLAEYEQDFAGLGFPPLLPALAAGDYDQLYRQSLAFDRRLRAFLEERSVGLNAFADLEGLKEYLEAV